MRAAIVGVGETPFRTRVDASLPELAQTAALEALAMAGMSPDDIDAVVFSMAPTEFVGVTDVDKWAVDAVGGRGKPFMRVHTGGATGGSAAIAGYLHVASGLHDTVLVVGADKVSETPSAQTILGLIWDPFVERGLGLNTVTMAAIQAVRHMSAHGTTEAQMAEVAVRARRRALRNPRAHLKGEISVEEVLRSRLLAWPLKLFDCCPRSSGAAAVVIASAPLVRTRGMNAAWINGVGSCTNTVHMGDRMGPRALTDMGTWEELKRAARVAYRQAGITDPISQVDVVETYAPFTINEIMAAEALGLCRPGDGATAIQEGRFDADGQLPVNPSGGTLCANPIGVTGLVRVCDAALQILGKAGGYQVSEPQVAVATSVGGSFQFQNCIVLGAEPTGAPAQREEHPT